MADRDIKKYATDMVELLKPESDRGCVLVASAYLEDALRLLLTTYCRCVSDVRDDELNKLFRSFDSQFANFASCIRLSRALGILTEIEQKMLLDFGVWRNKFAHGMADRLITPESIAHFIGPLADVVNEYCIPPMEDVLPIGFPLGRRQFMHWAVFFMVDLDCYHSDILSGFKLRFHSRDAKE